MQFFPICRRSSCCRSDRAQCDRWGRNKDVRCKPSGARYLSETVMHTRPPVLFSIVTLLFFCDLSLHLSGTSLMTGIVSVHPSPVLTVIMTFRISVDCYIPVLCPCTVSHIVSVLSHYTRVGSSLLREYAKRTEQYCSASHSQRRG